MKLREQLAYSLAGCVIYPRYAHLFTDDKKDLLEFVMKVNENNF